MWVYIVVGVLWITAWIQGIRYDKKDREENEIVQMVKNEPMVLPLMSFPKMTQSDNRADELRKLRDFIHAHYPGAEIRLVGEDDVFDTTGWERVPLLWHDLKIYIKRPEVWDERKFYSA